MPDQPGKLGARLDALRSGLPPLRGLLPLAVALAAWQALAPPNSPYFPPPSAWWTSVVTLAKTGRLLPAFTSTLLTFSLAIVLACVLGGLVGILIGRSPKARRALGPLLEFCRGLPPPVVVPVAVLVLGYVESLKLLVVVSVAIWPILLNTISGVREVDPLLVKSARSVGLSSPRLFQKVILPAAVPTIFTGIRLAGAASILILIAAEMVGAKAGLGYLINNSQVNFEIPQMYAGIVTVIFSLVQLRFVSGREVSL